jgi:hypothetical protein
MFHKVVVFLTKNTTKFQLNRSQTKQLPHLTLQQFCLAFFFNFITLQLKKMNPPCTGDQTTCGKQFNRAVACYQVPANFTFGSNWTSNSSVKPVSMSFCPDVAGFPTYDAATGTAVTRGSDGKLVVQTNCAPCNYATAVQPWVANPCPCIAAGDYCNISQGTNIGVCHSNGTTPCNSTQCPAPTAANPSTVLSGNDWGSYGGSDWGSYGSGAIQFYSNNVW